MSFDAVMARINIDPNSCFGKLCLRGHRKAVSLILDFLASGWSIPKTFENELGLEASEILACIAHDAEMSHRQSVEIGG
jgi:uncharacterized protein (DUF433 family)